MSDESRSTPIWAGYRVRLRGVEPADWETHYAWNQDSDAMRRVDRLYFPQSREFVKQWAERMALQSPASDTFHCQIETLAGDLVGVINTANCDARAGTFSYGIAIRPEHQRKGYASEAILLLARYFFQELRYQKMNAVVYSFNEPSLRLHERLGFQREGQQRRMIYTNGQHHDLIWFGMTREEFAERHAQSLPQ